MPGILIISLRKSSRGSVESGAGRAAGPSLGNLCWTGENPTIDNQTLQQTIRNHLTEKRPRGNFWQMFRFPSLPQRILCPPARKVPGPAFSLIEVVLAMGIITFALVTVIGLLPTGLNTFRQAMDQTTEGQIVQRLNAEMLLTPFSELLGEYGNKTLFFDDDGQAMADTGQSRYHVRTSLTDFAYPGWSNAVFPGTSSPKDAIAKNLQAIRIDIVKVPGPQQTNRYIIQVPNSGN